MPADRNQIKAMRVAVVARSGLRKTAVTTVAPLHGMLQVHNY